MKIFAEDYIPLLREHIYRSSSLKIKHTTGSIRTILSSPIDTPQDIYISSTVAPILNTFKYKDFFEIQSSKVISIEPKGLSKKNALPLFFQLNGINPSTDLLLFIADSDRDIEMARELGKYQAILGAVGNSTSNYYEFVRGYAEGVCSPTSTSYHGSVTYLLRAFEDLIEKRHLLE